MATIQSKEVGYPIYLVCGVPGSGKSWVLSHFTNTMHYDHHFNTPRKHYAQKLIDASKLAPVIADCPLGVSEIISYILDKSHCVIPLFVIESPAIVAARYYHREHKPIPKQHLSRIDTMRRRALLYKAFSGTSFQVYIHLLEIGGFNTYGA